MNEALLAEIADLRRQLDYKTNEVRYLKDLLLPPPPQWINRLWGLTKTQSQILLTIYREDVTNDRLMYVMYPSGEEPSDPMNVLRAQLSRMRDRLPPEVVIINYHGVGYGMAQDSREYLAKMMETLK